VLAAGAIARAVQPVQPWSDVSTVLTVTLATATLIGLALFVRDCLALRRGMRRWLAHSRPADELRQLLPRELARTPARIRLVADSTVAATSGCLLPTIWIGDRFAGERLRLIVIHEMSHASARDPLWIALIAAVRRAYWWNPLVAHLARQAVLMIESTCDHRSAAHFDKPRYVAELASLVLTIAAPPPAMIAAAHAANLDVQRLRLLRTTLRLRARDVVVVAALGAGAAATAMIDVVAREAGPLALGPPATPSSGAPRAVAVAVDQAAVLDEWLSTYAYTPQQHFGNR
jgi:beta-lactamase regulating signal transducer with metallopeptidase domain